MHCAWQQLKLWALAVVQTWSQSEVLHPAGNSEIFFFFNSSENFSECYFPFRWSELSNLFVDIVDWVQTMTFSLNLLA